MNLKKNVKRFIIGGAAVAAVVIGVVSLKANAALHVRSFMVASIPTEHYLQQNF